MKELLGMRFKTVVKKMGHSGHILVPKYLVGKQVEISIEVIED